MRIDKYLWSIRTFKTRSMATAAVRDGKVEVGGQAVKPSRDIREGESVAIRKGPIWIQIEVKALPPSRVGAKLVEDYMTDVTPKEDLEKLEIMQLERRLMPPMKGRPTKRDRRKWGKWMG